MNKINYKIKKINEETSLENSVRTCAFYKKENPLIAYCIATKYNLIDELIDLLESKNRFYHAAILSQNNGLIKKAIENYRKCGFADIIQEIKESLIPIKFSKKTSEKEREIELMSRIMAQSPKSQKEFSERTLSNFYYKN